MVFLRGLTDFVLDGNGSRFQQSSVVNGELKGDPPPDRAPYCGSSGKFTDSEGSIPTGFDIMWFIEGGCDLVFQNMNIVGLNTAGNPGGTLQQDSAIEVAGAQRILVTKDTVNGVFGDFVTVTGLHEAPYGGLSFPAFDVTVTNNSFNNGGRQGVTVVYGDRVTVTGNSILNAAATAIDLEAEVGGGVEGDILINNNTIRGYSYLVAAITYGQLFNFAFTNNATGPTKIVLHSETKSPGHDLTISGNVSNETTAWSNDYDILFNNEITGLVSANTAPVGPPTPDFVHVDSTSGNIAVQNNTLTPGFGAPPSFLPYPLTAPSSAAATECANSAPTGGALDTRASPPGLAQCVNVSPVQPIVANLPVYVAP
jgi:parallel beta helix pectate lyase-like protein